MPRKDVGDGREMEVLSVSHLPKVTSQVRWGLPPPPGWASLGTQGGVVVGSQLSLGHSNAQKSLTSRLEGFYGII